MTTIWSLSEFILFGIVITWTVIICERYPRINILDLVQNYWQRIYLFFNKRFSPTGKQISLAAVESMHRQLISNFSHEVRTPLTTSYGYMQSIYRRSENLTPFQKEALEIAISEMKLTIDLLQESLDLARVDRDSICFLPTTVHLNSLILETVMTHQEAQKRKVILEVEDVNISAQGDTIRLKQVLSELLDNAIKYSDDVVTIKLEKLKNCVTMSVCDRGCGISSQDQSHIFTPFYRVDPSRSRITGGVGLGLAIAKVLVEGMGGTLNVYSHLGQGSIFEIALKSSN
jgi:signal transduction histidine kinase